MNLVLPHTPIHGNIDKGSIDLVLTVMLKKVNVL